jgi:hypothetical protein
MQRNLALVHLHKTFTPAAAGIEWLVWKTALTLFRTKLFSHLSVVRISALLRKCIPMVYCGSPRPGLA